MRDLANGVDSSDEDEDEKDNIWRRLRYSRWSVNKEEDDAAAFKAALGRVGHRTQDSTESQEGLMYARSEDDEHNYPPANNTRDSEAFPHSIHSIATSTKILSSRERHSRL